ncbi:hypothetical protein BGX28_004542 [Mortierella sp. GBA30]|nr:hypothetical protein BGX28_004542 [Mortierella sp. GBA30]
MANFTTSTKQGPPAHLVVRPMTVEDKEEVAQLFVRTFRREPLGEYCGVEDSEGRSIAEAAMKDPVSFVVEDTNLDGPHRIIAFRTSCLFSPDQDYGHEEKETMTSPIQAVLQHMQDLWLAKSTIFKTKRDAKVMKFIALGVDSRYEGLGLAKELLNRSMERAKELNCDAVTVVASAFATQHLFRNRLAFEEMGTIRYSDFVWKNPAKGGIEERPFENLHEPEFLEVFEKRV